MDIGFRYKIIFSATRVEVLSKNNVRLAVNSGEKNFFHRKAPSSFSFECGESGEFLKDSRFLAVKFFLPHSPDFLHKRNCRTGVRTTHWMSPTTYSPSVTCVNGISCEFKIRVEISDIYF